MFSRAEGGDLYDLTRMALEHHIGSPLDGSSLLLISLRSTGICPFEVHLLGVKISLHGWGYLGMDS